MDPERSRLIDALLPQTQCTRCGYVDCRAYADAIASGLADINRCAPGGERTIAALSRLTGRPVRSLAPECGPMTTQQVAAIDEARCIGCTLCIQACPIDAIIGGPKRMHTVLASLCSGCELCVPACPVDCIALLPTARDWHDDDAEAARLRHDARQHRLERAQPVAQRRSARTAALTSPAQREAAVVAALARARARRNSGAAGRGGA
jgi:electron transport complex protein RnfB